MARRRSGPICSYACLLFARLHEAIVTAIAFREAHDSALIGTTMR